MVILSLGSRNTIGVQRLTESTERRLTAITRIQRYNTGDIMRNQKGKNNNAYKNGIGMYKQTKGDKCSRCNSTTKLCVHHIDKDRTNNELSNLETICRRCHALEHDCISRLPKGEELSKLSKAVKRNKDPLTGRFIKKE